MFTYESERPVILTLSCCWRVVEHPTRNIPVLQFYYSARPFVDLNVNNLAWRREFVGLGQIV